MIVVLSVLSAVLAVCAALLVRCLIKANARVAELLKYRAESLQMERRIRIQTKIIAAYADENAKRRLSDEYQRGVRDGRNIELAKNRCISVCYADGDMAGK